MQTVWELRGEDGSEEEESQEEKPPAPEGQRTLGVSDARLEEVFPGAKYRFW